MAKNKHRKLSQLRHKKQKQIKTLQNSRNLTGKKQKQLTKLTKKQNYLRKQYKKQQSTYTPPTISPNKQIKTTFPSINKIINSNTQLTKKQTKQILQLFNKYALKYTNNLLKLKSTTPSLQKRISKEIDYNTINKRTGLTDLEFMLDTLINKNKGTMKEIKEYLNRKQTTLDELISQIQNNTKNIPIGDPPFEHIPEGELPEDYEEDEYVGEMINDLTKVNGELELILKFTPPDGALYFFDMGYTRQDILDMYGQTKSKNN